MIESHRTQSFDEQPAGVCVSAETVTTELSAIVSGLTEVVDTVLDHLNLLSLNVALEAARSGDPDRALISLLDKIDHLAQAAVTITAELSVRVDMLQEEVSNAPETLSTESDSLRSLLPELMGKAEQLSQTVFQIAAFTANTLSAALSESVDLATVCVQAAAVEDSLTQSALTLMQLTGRLQNRA